MHRCRVTRAALAVVLGLLGLSGCALPTGVDGNLVDDWPRPPTPVITVPAASACYAVPTANPAEVLRWPDPVTCDQPHTVETLFVGGFTGAEAERAAPPPSGGPERRRAYTDCGTRARAFLGDDWRMGRLDLFLVLPSAVHWEAGARWYRCDVVEYADLEDFAVVNRSASLAGALTSQQLRLTCVSVGEANGEIDKVLPADCASDHNGEFVGLFEPADVPYPTDPAERTRVNLDGCRELVAGYAAIPNDPSFQYRTGQVASPFPKSAWEQGNRGVRCYLWAPKPVKGSLKGAGPTGLPINYA